MKITNTKSIHNIEVTDGQLDMILVLFSKTPYYVYDDKYNFCVNAGYKLSKASEDEYNKLFDDMKTLVKSR